MSVYVVEVREGRSEFKVVEALGEAGVVAYAPAVRHWRRRSGFKCAVARQALIAGYVFAWSDAIGRDLPAILDVRQVEQVLGGDRPLALIGPWLERLLLAETFGAFDYTRDRTPRLSVGQQVRIVGGAFQGLVATVKALGGGAHGKVKVSVKDRFFAGALTLARDHVEPTLDSLRKSAA